MISLSAEAKQKYAKYVGADGKLIIDESLPDELKEIFQYFNDRNINILELNINDEVIFDDEEESLLDDEEDEYDDDNDDDIQNEIIEDDSNVNMDELNNLFN